MYFNIDFEYKMEIDRLKAIHCVNRFFVKRITSRDLENWKLFLTKFLIKPIKISISATLSILFFYFFIIISNNRSFKFYLVAISVL